MTDPKTLADIIFGTDVLDEISRAPSLLELFVRGNAYIDEHLSQCIVEHLGTKEKLEIKEQMSFNLKVDISTALNIVSSETKGLLRAVNKIRNEYAHNSSYLLEDRLFRKMVDSLSPRLKKAYDEGLPKISDHPGMLHKCLFLVTMACIITKGGLDELKRRKHPVASAIATALKSRPISTNAN